MALAVYWLRHGGDYFASAKNNEVLDHLLQELHIEKKEQAEENGTAFTGMTFVITGSVEHFANRKELQALIESKGGKATGSVTSKTTYLIDNDTQSSSSKNKRQRNWGFRSFRKKIS